MHGPRNGRRREVRTTTTAYAGRHGCAAGGPASRYRSALVGVSMVVLLLVALVSTPGDSPILYAAAAPHAPPAQNGPLPVFLQLQYSSINKIDGIEQSFSSDFYMLITWPAPKHDPAVDVSDDLNDLADSYWQPQIDFVNAVGGVTRLAYRPLSFRDEPLFDLASHNYVLPDGWIWCSEDQRYTASFETPVQMRAFPFDSQRALLQIESFWGDDVVKIIFAEPDRLTLAGLLPPSMPPVLGWTPLGVSVHESRQVYQYNRQSYNRLELAIELRRDASFYLTKLVSGCVMLVAMCISLFILAQDSSDRLAGTMSIFAALVGYLFVASAYTPILPYSTALDQFLICCFLAVVAMCAVHVVMYLRQVRANLAQAVEAAEAAQAASSPEKPVATVVDRTLAEMNSAARVARACSTMDHAAGVGSEGATAVEVVAPAPRGRLSPSSSMASMRMHDESGFDDHGASKDHVVHVHFPAALATDSCVAGSRVVGHAATESDEDAATEAVDGSSTVTARRRMPAAGPASPSAVEKPARTGGSHVQPSVANAALTSPVTGDDSSVAPALPLVERVAGFFGRLGISRPRIIDVVWVIVFSFGFSIATAVIFGLPQSEQA